MIGYVILVIIVVLAAFTAIRAKSLIRAALALGLGSAALAMLFFLMDAPYAGGFELSVGAGLISVLFIIAISLTQTLGERDREA
ncbi:MAG TPA: DUF4040 domain-containing protein [Anaerolineae bacterium]|nr:DUF4040 domain-containing protein [Anaerolineae bacterium]